MPTGLVLLVAFCIAGVPVAGLAVLATTGRADPAAAGALLLLTSAAAFTIARLWAGGQARMIRLIRRAAEGAPGETSELWLSRALGREIDRLGRIIGEQTGRLGQQLRTEEAIVESLPDPLIVLAADRSILRANAAARSAYGPELLAVLRHPVLRAAIDRTLAQGSPQIADVTLPVPVEQEVHATVFALGPAQAGNSTVATVLSDRTRERALERMRADFVANASHELRTPLASLIGFIDTLRGPAADDPPAQARFLQIMAEQAGRMNRLIDDLLSLSRIELTEHQAPAGKVILGELVRWVAASFEPQVAVRGLHIDLAVAPDLPLVPGDEDQLVQVLHNLMENAVKYGREGGIVRVVAAAVPPGGRWPAREGVTLAVSDDGQGIAPEHLPRLTERFYRVDRGRSRAVGGTGLGLAIVKHIVNRHRGQLAIESREGAGATFTVWLPQQAAISGVLTRPRPPKPGPP